MKRPDWQCRHSQDDASYQYQRFVPYGNKEERFNKDKKDVKYERGGLRLCFEVGHGLTLTSLCKAQYERL